jgi:NAD(P)H dehydrogenase (quinone)
MPNPRYVVTAAAGQLGRLVVATLAERAGPGAVAAVVRDPARAAGLFPAGVAVRHGDYDAPGTLDDAFAGAERILLISSNAVGVRVAQHRNAIDAAARAGVARIAYTRVLHADRSALGLAGEHRETEALIAASGLPYTLLRNGWYSENYAAAIPAARAHGALIGSAGAGRISGAARRDYADAAAIALLAADAPAAAVHELAGDTAFTLADFAAELSRQTGRDIPYVDMPEAAYRDALVGAGLPEAVARLLADSDAQAAQGALYDDSGQLSRLIGRPTTPLATVIAAALAA